MNNQQEEKREKKKLSTFYQLFSLPEDKLIKWLPYVLFLSLIGVVYIYNSHMSERRIRRINNIETEVEKKRWEYITIKSELMNKSKLSEMEKLVSEDLKKSLYPPIKIKMNK